MAGEADVTHTNTSAATHSGAQPSARLSDPGNHRSNSLPYGSTATEILAHPPVPSARLSVGRGPK